MSKHNQKVVRHPSAPTAPDRQLFGDWLRNRRYDQSYTQASVVQRLRHHRSQAWLSRFENGRFLRLMPVEEFRDLCRILSLNPVEVLVVCGFVVDKEVRDYLTSHHEHANRAAR